MIGIFFLHVPEHPAVLRRLFLCWPDEIVEPVAELVPVFEWGRRGVTWHSHTSCEGEMGNGEATWRDMFSIAPRFERIVYTSSGKKTRPKTGGLLAESV